jgi:tetratricopeptide (TPR) repeat protein
MSQGGLWKMPGLLRLFAIGVLLVVPTQGIGQIEIRQDLELDPPRKMQPALAPAASRKHFAAVRLFLQAQCFERESRLLDAVKAYEQALKLEPKAISIYKALIPLCFNLDRSEQALEYCRQAIVLDPTDYELLYRYGREMQERGRLEEAAATLAKAAKLPSAKDHPEHLAEMCFSLGVLCEELKQYDQAALAFEQVVEILDSPEALGDGALLLRRQIDAESAKTYERLGRVYLKAKHYEKAMQAFRKAQQKDAVRGLRLHFNLAEVYLDKKEPRTALEHLNKYLTTQPAGTEAYELLIEVLTQLQRQADILPAIETAANRDEFNMPLKLLLAKQYLQARRFDRAEALILLVWKDNPSEDAYRCLGQLYRLQGRWKELLTLLNEDLGELRNLPAARAQLRILANDPALVEGIARTALNLPRSQPPLAYQTRRSLATLCRQTRHLEEAEQLLRRCLPEDPQPGEVYVELCRVLGEAKKYDALVEICREAATKQLKVPALVFRQELARTLVLAGKKAEAVAVARQLVNEAKPDSEELSQARYTLAAIYSRTQQFDLAVSECESLLKQATEPKELRRLHYLLSGIYSLQHDQTRSEFHLLKVLDIDPEDAGANNDLGYSWADQGKNLEQAERMIRKAIDVDRAERQKKAGALEIPDEERDNAAYLDSLGWVLYRQGKIGESLRHLERAVSIAEGKEDPVIWDHLGEVYRELQHYDKARHAWEKSLEMYEASARTGAVDRRKDVAKKLKLLEDKVSQRQGTTNSPR